MATARRADAHELHVAHVAHVAATRATPKRAAMRPKSMTAQRVGNTVVNKAGTFGARNGQPIRTPRDLGAENRRETLIRLNTERAKPGSRSKKGTVNPAGIIRGSGGQRALSSYGPPGRITPPGANPAQPLPGRPPVFSPTTPIVGRSRTISPPTIPGPKPSTGGALTQARAPGRMTATPSGPMHPLLAQAHAAVGQPPTPPRERTANR